MPVCVCVTLMCVEQGKYTAAGEEAECACIRVCTRPREAAIPRTLEPRCVCGEEYASRVVCMAMGAHQCARLEGTSDGVTGRRPARARARVCVCVCERERERERQGERRGEGERDKQGWPGRGRERRRGREGWS